MEGSPREYEGMDGFTAGERWKLGKWRGLESIKTTLDTRRRKGSEERDMTRLGFKGTVHLKMKILTLMSFLTRLLLVLFCGT